MWLRKCVIFIFNYISIFCKSHGTKKKKLITYLEAVKICEELVVMALIGELWAFISPSRLQESAAHNFTMPARQPDRISCPPGMNVNPQTQSL
jgi:hypothetical protein